MNKTKKNDNPNDRNGLLNLDQNRSEKTSKKKLSRYSLTMKDLKVGDIAYTFEEDSQEISKVIVKSKENSLVLINEKGFSVRYPDVIFKTEQETNRYKNAPFM